MVGRDETPWWVYVLREPKSRRTLGPVRYVGFTVSANRRLAAHLAEARKGGSVPRSMTLKSIWIRRVLSLGRKPVMQVVESGRGYGGSAAEKRWVKHYLATGVRLLNRTQGGCFDPPAGCEALVDDPTRPANLLDLVSALAVVIVRAGGEVPPPESLLNRYTRNWISIGC
jgi:hypothetical protein